VYREDVTDPAKQARANAWLSLLFERRQGRTSFQVMQELYSVLTQKLTAINAAEARQIVRELTAWRPVTPDVPLLERSWLLQERYSLSWWDALVVAAAHASHCRVLLTEDLQHDQVLDEVRVINPFRSPERTPAEILDALS
jgi:predicted nucleic acid-binding protein